MIVPLYSRVCLSLAGLNNFVLSPLVIVLWMGLFAGSGLVTMILGDSKRKADLCGSHLSSNGIFSVGVSSRHSIEGQGHQFDNSLVSKFGYGSAATTYCISAQSVSLVYF